MQSLNSADLNHIRAADGWLDLGDPAEARGELQQVPDSLQGHPDVLELWWRLQALESDWEAALRSARTLVLTEPKRATGWIHQSYSLHELKRTEEAWHLLLSAADRFPGESIIAYNLACYACQLGHLADSLEWLQRAMKIGRKREIQSMALSDPDLGPLRDFIQKL
jgi:Flp pilus assembly protein TadD